MSHTYFRYFLGNFKLYLLPITLFIFCLSSCNSDSETVPEGILTPDQMTRFLVQVHYAETRTINSGMQLDSSLVMYHYLNNRILRGMKLDTGIVNRSVRFYSKSPKLTAKIYERVVDSLTARNATGNVRF